MRIRMGFGKVNCVHLRRLRVVVAGKTLDRYYLTYKG
jgi:hypothetical protein